MCKIVAKLSIFSQPAKKKHDFLSKKLQLNEKVFYFVLL